jgi:hypothetical protein
MAWLPFDDGALCHEPDSLYGTQGDVPFETASETSAQAAGAMRAHDLARLEAIVLAAIKARPRTCDDVEIVTGLTHQSASARIRGLVLRDQLVDSGRRAKTRHGRNAVVWCVKTA